MCGDLPGVPTANVIRLARTGLITVEGPVAADGPDVSRAAYLLETLLQGVNGLPHIHASGALRLVIARARGRLDLPPYPSLDAFAEALTRFAEADGPSVVRKLHATWTAASPRGTIAGGERQSDASHDEAATDTGGEVDGSALTVSDIRRARRETRLTLTDVSEGSRIPVWLLRELEWGYFRNWPGGLYGRSQLVRYARAAGLDERLVVRTVWPAVEAEARGRGGAAIAPEDLQPADPEELTAAAVLVPIERGEIVTLTPGRAGRRPYRIAAALSLTALLALALLPVIRDRGTAQSAPTPRPALESPASTPAVPPPTSDAAATSDAPARAAAPRANADGQQVIEPPGFTDVGAAMFEPDTGDGLILARHTGGMTLRITRVADDGARSYHERVSPDGGRIAFDSDRDGQRGVYVADIDGRHVRRVSGDGPAALPSWSPDSRALLFTRAETDHPDVWNLWSADLDRGRRRRLTSHEAGRPWGASWFPDGRRIAYTRDASLVVLDTESGEEHEFPSPLRARPMRGLAVSPDGRHVIVNVLRDGAWLLAVPDGSMRRVLDDPTADAFSWAPDGRRVAYHSSRSGGWNVWVKAGA